MAETQRHTNDPQAPPMHHRDWGSLIILGIPAALAITIFSVGLGAFVTGSTKWGFSLCTPSLSALIVMAVLLFKARSTPRLSPYPRPHLFIALTAMTLLTWAFFGWQTWMWFHPPIQPAGYTQAQLDDYATKKVVLATKPLSDQIEQLTKEIGGLRQGSPETAKVIASLRAQIAQLQSDKPISVDKLPTSLQLHFANNSVEEIASKNVVWTKVFGWRERKALLTTQSYAGWTIIIVFKRPIAYKSVHFDDHSAGLGLVPSLSPNHDPYFVVLEFDSIFLDGLLLDIAFDNKELSK